jgi:AcrR family transcriptional regulator
MRAKTAQRILESAQEEFARCGFEGATIRGIAKRAEVHPSLVLQHYETKAALFALATRLPHGDPSAAADHLYDVLSVRLSDMPVEAQALIRSMLTTPEATAMVKAFLDERIENLAGSIDADDAPLRATLTVCSILGITLARHFLKLDTLENRSPEEIVEAVHPWITQMLEG